MVDREIFSRRLDALDLYLERAERLGEVSEDEFAETPAIHDLAERYLHLAMEASIDLANHWIADRALRTPESNRDSFSVLEETGEIAFARSFGSSLFRVRAGLRPPGAALAGGGSGDLEG